MGNLDWGSKFSIDMSQNSGEDKKVHPLERNYLASQKIIESIMLRFFFVRRNNSAWCFFFII